MSKGSLSDYAFGRVASLSQRAAAEKTMLQKTVGSDPEISDAIAVMSYLADDDANRLRKKDPLEWTIGLLDVLRISHFATSERTDIISKLGFFSPQKEIRVIDE